MSDYEKKVSPLDRWREMSGLYKLGFDPESAKGLAFPFVTVALIGGLLGAFIKFVI